MTIISTVIDVPARAATRFTGDLDVDALPGRDLDQEELRALASTIAGDPGRWRHHLAFSDDDRVYVSLHRDAHVDGRLHRHSVSYADELRPIDPPTGIA